MLGFANSMAKLSLDYSFQTGVTLGKKTKGGYKHIASAYNKVVPYQTYALHYGASRETNFSVPHDLNHYDAIHAEVALILKVAANKLDLADASLFINLLPCPSCARMFTQTPITDFIYTEDHSAGYAVQLLEKAGKTVRRVVPALRAK
jgi:deoxycytidylate deaminase